MTNQYSEKSKLNKMLHNSQTLKIKHGWSREVGAGFICEDLQSVTLAPNNHITIKTEAFTQTLKTSDFNLRETEELLKFLNPLPSYVVRSYFDGQWETVYTGTNKQDALDRLIQEA